VLLDSALLDPALLDWAGFGLSGKFCARIAADAEAMAMRMMQRCFIPASVSGIETRDWRDYDSLRGVTFG
jgi:hypothetical protein